MSSSKQRDFDIVIIGSGPAGITAAMWADELGLSAALIDRRNEPGGQLLSIYNPIDNYPGICAANGTEFRDRLIDQLSRRTFKQMLGAEVKSIDPATLSVGFGGNDPISARSLILATGVRRRKLGVPGETEFSGKGIIESGKRHEHDVAGKRVVIIGGGDAALENALILGRRAMSVTLIHRRSAFSARTEFIDAAERLKNVSKIMPATVESIVGDERVRDVRVRSANGNEVTEIGADVVLVRIGVEPMTELVRDAVETDHAGYIVVDSAGRTSVRGLYAVGDCANPISPTISSAAGMAVTAVKSIYYWLNY